MLNYSVAELRLTTFYRYSGMTKPQPKCKNIIKRTAHPFKYVVSCFVISLKNYNFTIFFQSYSPSLNVWENQLEETFTMYAITTIKTKFMRIFNGNR